MILENDPLKKHGSLIDIDLNKSVLNMAQIVRPDKKEFLKLATTKMPFGKYKGIRLVDLPEPYLVWFSQKGFPEGKLGELLRTVYEIKRNGLEYLFKSFS